MHLARVLPEVLLLGLSLFGMDPSFLLTEAQGAFVRCFVVVVDDDADVVVVERLVSQEAEDESCRIERSLLSGLAFHTRTLVEGGWNRSY